MEKVCTKCLESFPIEHFHLKGAGRRNSRCPKCCYEWAKDKKAILNAYKKQRYWDNIEESRARNLRNAKAYYRRNTEKIKELARKRHASNKEHANQSSRAYYAAHKDAMLKRTKGWRADNLLGLREYSQQYRKAHVEQVRASNQNRRAKLVGAEGKYTADQWRELKEIYRHKCPSCSRSEPDIKLTVDHIVPLSCGGGNGIDNIQPLCRSCNSSKQAKAIRYQQ